MGTRFSRLISLCGLTQQEAADYLGIAKRTVAMKATDLRRATADETMALAELWSRIDGGSLSEDDPPAAFERRIALFEAAEVLGGSGGQNTR